ncbi:uncharacterized protein LOC110367082 [Fundulus heteroclitus]|uniref:uncharacterized protein LOC110367082 n=1 Tax=Fundulus heteroclitus TaxID=8078 RepID=UPI00165AC1E5|nr:uncharacterized protein LOC110367082 [Fundulus heteroclitus]
MKMRILLPGVFLGLLAVIHSSPIDSMTQVSPKQEDDVLEEVMTDGFLVDHPFGTSFTTEPPKRNTMAQASQQPSSEVEGSGVFEHSGISGTESPEMSTTVQAALLPFSSEGSGFLVTPTSPIGKTPEMTTIPTTPTLDVSVEESGTTINCVSSFKDLRAPSLQTTSEDTPEGSGDSLVSSTTTLSASTTLPPTISNQPEEPRIIPDSGNVKGARMYINPAERTNSALPHVSEGPNSQMQNGHVTPDWIIILGFIVGVAALVALCAAIATRDKWNAPKEMSENKTNVSNQKREQEMQTFLHKEEPKQNGKEAEYTVIPLNDLPDCYSSD